MNNKRYFSSSPERAGGLNYQITVKGYLDRHWEHQLEGLKISHDDQGNSLLTGSIPDQAALHGVLVQVRDLGMTLLTLTSHPIGEEGRQAANDGDNENGA
jgi:hypothetical protein